MSEALIATSQRTRAGIVRLIAVAVALLLVSLLVVGNSRAAFTDTAAASGSWGAAEVNLSADASDGVLVSADGLMPGDVVSGDVTVTYGGTADSVDVRLYGESLDDSGLADHLNLTVEVAGSTVYDGSLTAFASAHTDFADGADSWDGIAPGDTRTYDVTVELDAGTPDSAQGADASVSFVWEARSG